MSKSNLLAVLGIILCGFIAWYCQSRNDELLEPETPPTVTTASAPSLTADTNSDGEQEAILAPEERQEIQIELQEVQERIVETQATMEETRERLETLVASREIGGPEENEAQIGDENLQQQTEQDVAYIQQLNDQLQDLAQEEGNLIAASESPGVEGTQATMAARDQLGEEIRLLEESIATNEIELQNWLLNSGYLNEQEENVLRLQSELDIQRQQLEDLRSQRGGLFSETLENTQSIQMQKDRRLQEIDMARESILGEIERLRTQVQQRQSLSYDDQLSRLGNEEEITVLRENYEEDRREMQRLEEERRRLESELLAL